MTSPIFRCSLFCLVLFLGGVSYAGMNGATNYTERGKADFDTVLQILNPYGTWAKVGDVWAFTPLDHEAPYTNGRWIYTEYGWYWKGNRPHSWATEHYGYWKRGADKVWSWYPGPFWLPQIVEIRATDKYIGWRCPVVDRDGNFTEDAADRYAKTDEWTFVTLAQFANPIMPEIVAKPDEAKKQLEDSTECRHTYWTYRIIDRPGPHPADFSDLSKDGGMLAPKTLEDQAAEQAAAAQKTAAPSTNAPPKVVTGVTPPSLNGNADINPAADKRKVKYWVTMSLPTFWAPKPPEAKVDEMYLYRPDFYQDQDGINRRVTLWFNPQSRATLKELLGNGLPSSTTKSTAGSTTKPAPSEPSAPPKRRDAFQSPFDESYRPSQDSPASKPAAAPSGATNGLIPLPLVNATNAAPANPQ